MSGGSRATVLLVMIAACLAGMPARADEAPLWELGLGIGTASFPEYRGSKERSSFAVPIPYLVYRGERLRADRDGIRGLLGEMADWELDVSIDGAVPVDSTDDGPRAGMAELDPVVEYGPSLVRRLGRNEWGHWTLRLPLRAVTAVDPDSLATSHEGWTLQPSIRLDAPGLIGNWDTRLSLGPRFGSRDYHAYYYDVGAEDVQPGRDTYRADAGYSGLGLHVSAARRSGKVWTGAFLRYDNLAGATFEDSPLVETKHAVSAGFGVSWILGEAGRAKR